MSANRVAAVLAIFVGVGIGVALRRLFAER
jgi:hypothetical protein